MLGLRPIELFLIELIGFMLLWMIHPYIAFMLCLIFAGISFCLLIFSLIAEGLERSKVPKTYFYIMGCSVLAPLIALALNVAFQGLDFLHESPF
ncbi:MAG: hypothetical protein AAFP19_08695 [Bacteroidota bacterium]